MENLTNAHLQFLQFTQIRQSELCADLSPSNVNLEQISQLKKNCEGNHLLSSPLTA